MQLPGAENVDRNKSVSSSHACSTSFFTEMLQRLESVRKMDRQMAVRMMRIAIRSVVSSRVVVVVVVVAAAAAVS